MATLAARPRGQTATLAHWQVGDLVSYQHASRQFQVEKVLVGGMGVVYVVTDTRNGDPFVVKGMREQMAYYPALKARFQREAEAWIALEKHANIVQAIGFEYLGGQPHIFLEYVSRGSLRDLLRDSDLPIPDMLKLAMEVCRGMRHAVLKGMKAHRDLKPDNILLTANFTAKVTDFGLVKLFDDTLVEEGEQAETHAGPFTLSPLTKLDSPGFGTKEYMPPEQWRNAGKADIRSDVYSFGVMLYEMLTSIRPFYGKDRDELQKRHTEYTPPPPSVLRSDIPPVVDRLVQQCLEKDPEKRYQNFTTLHRDLVHILQQEYRQVVTLQTQEQLSVDELNERGAALFNLGKYPQALVCFDKVLKNAPDHALAWANRGVTLAEQRHYTAALNSFDQALAAEPNNAIILTNKGVTLFEMQQYEQSLACYDRALSLERRLRDAWRYKSEVLNLLERFEDAYYAALKARQIDPDDEKACFQEAVALIGMKRVESAAGAVSRYEALTRKQSSSVRFLRARIARVQGNERQCLLYCASIEREAPEYRDALLMGMACALALGDLDEVDAVLSGVSDPQFSKDTLPLMLQALELPGTPSVRFLMRACETAAHAGDFVAARYFYETWQDRGRISGLLDRYTPELSAEAIAKQTPDDPYQMIAQGILLWHLDDAKAAVRCLQSGLKKAPKSVTGWQHLVEIFNHLGEYARAFRVYQTLSTLQPADRDTWLHFAEGCLRLGKYDTALEALEKAQQHGGDSKISRLLSGCACLGKKQFRQALKHLNAATNEDDKLALAWWNKCLCLRQMGRHVEANRAMHRARDLDVRLWRLSSYQQEPLLLYPLAASSLMS